MFVLRSLGTNTTTDDATTTDSASYLQSITKEVVIVTLNTLLLLLLMLLLGAGIRETMILIRKDDHAVDCHEAADAPQGPSCDDNIM